MKIVYLALVTAVVTVAAVIDFRTWKIPNWLTVPLAATGLVTRLIVEADRWATIKDMAAGFAIGFGILFVLWLIAGGGAGDVKMMGGVGIWVGTTTIILFLLSAAVVLAIELVRFLIRLVNPSAADKRRGTLEQFKSSGKKQRSRLPYAVSMAITCWILLALKVLKVTLNVAG